MRLTPAAIRVLHELLMSHELLELHQLSYRTGLDLHTTANVLRDLQQTGAVMARTGVPGLQRPLWQITEAGFEVLTSQEPMNASQPATSQPVGSSTAPEQGAPGQPMPPAYESARHPLAQPQPTPYSQVPAYGPPQQHHLVDSDDTQQSTYQLPRMFTRLEPSRKSRRKANQADSSIAAVDAKTRLAPVRPDHAKRSFLRKPVPKISQLQPAGQPSPLASGLASSSRKRRTAVRKTVAGAKRTLLATRRRAVFALLTLLVLITGGFAVAGLRAVNVTISGIEPDVILHPSNLVDSSINFDVEGGNPANARLRLDGLPVSGLQRNGDRVSWVVPPLTDGTHTLSLEIPRRLFGNATAAVSFTVDSIPPELGLPSVHPPVRLDEPFVLTSAIDPSFDLVIDGEPIDTSDGTFTIRRDLPPAGPITFVAVDAAGNTTTLNMTVPISYPATTGVHVSAAAWDHDGLRQGIVDLIEDNMISAVQLDLKDESGRIGYASDIELAQRNGATLGLFDLKEAIDELHGLGVRVIGRIVAFRDPILGQHALATGNADWVIQNQNGQPLRSSYGNGAFTNFANEDVRQYNLDIAVEAAEAGIDDVLWDYMRRPEGNFSEMRVPGFEGTDPSPLIVSFLADAGEVLREHQVYHGVSVFGIAARRGDDIAQDVVAISDHVDYVSPMVYPSHWGRGEYGVEHPEAQPYDIVEASLQDFQKVLAGTNTVIVPWLQDFSIQVNYGAEEVQAQIRAAADIGISNWLLWDPTVTYTEGGIPPG